MLPLLTNVCPAVKGFVLIIEGIGSWSERGGGGSAAVEPVTLPIDACTAATRCVESVGRPSLPKIKPDGGELPSTQP